jgi:prefoldin subunit 5
VKKKVEAKGRQAKQEAKKRIEDGQEDLRKKVDDLKRKAETSQEDLNKVDDVHKDVNDLLKKVDPPKQQDQKAK